MKEIALGDYEPSHFEIPDVELLFEIYDEKTIVHSRLQVLRKDPKNQELKLDGIDLELLEITVDGKKLEPRDYRLADNLLVLTIANNSAVVEITNAIYPHLNLSLEGLYRSAKMFCSQCEAQGFRKITYFLDRPDVLSRYKITLRADREKYPTLLAGGNLIGQRLLEEGRHETRWEDPFPRPSYLFALVAGDLACREDRYQTRSGQDVALELYTDHQNADKTLFAMDALKQAMRWDEERFALEYDLKIYMIVAVNDFNMGAMENRGLNIFNSHYVLASQETATDEDILGIYSVVGHEYFHNWTGNRVTLRDWFQLSLKEGLTVYRDQEFSSDIGSRGIVRLDNVVRMKSVQFSEDAGPMAHPVKPKRYAEINNFYTATVYEKGSELIRMMASWLGREGFTKGLQLYLKKFDGRAATTEDFVSALEQGSGQSLAPLISWYDIPGTPEVSVETKFLKGSGPSAGATTVTENTFEVTLAQDNPKAKELGHKQYLQTIPLNFKLFAPSGAEVEVREQSAAGLRTQKDQGQVTNLFVLDQEKQSYRFSCLEQPILSLNRDFSAPVHIHYQRSLADSLTLFAHEQDPYAKFDAGQRVALDLIRQRYLGSADHAGEQHYLVALGQVLSQWRSDPAFLAKMIKLPPLVQTLQFERQVDLVKMDQAIQGLYQQMANTHQLLLMDILSQCHDMASKIPWSEGVGFRAMKLSCLSLLSRMRNQTAAAVIEQTYRDATNMTESFGAFALLMDAEPSQARDEWESHFFQKWQHEYLVINKWFQAIASSRSPDAYSRFKALCLHPAFSLQNPNRCRALIGGFVRGNLVHYHGHNGEPYQSVLQLIREIDGFNPQLAAALAKASTSDLVALTSATRKDLRQTLSRVMDGGANPVSKDLAEIVQRTQEFFATLDGLKS